MMANFTAKFASNFRPSRRFVCELRQKLESKSEASELFYVLAFGGIRVPSSLLHLLKSHELFG